MLAAQRHRLTDFRQGDLVELIEPGRDASWGGIVVPVGTRGKLGRLYRVQEGLEMWAMWLSIRLHGKRLLGVAHTQIRRVGSDSPSRGKMYAILVSDEQWRTVDWMAARALRDIPGARISRSNMFRNAAMEMGKVWARQDFLALLATRLSRQIHGEIPGERRVRCNPWREKRAAFLGLLLRRIGDTSIGGPR